MPDYKEMYLRLFRATQDAVEILIQAQQDCEELYLSSPEPEVILLADRKDEGGEPLC